MSNCISEPKYRMAECDIIRGILIVFVVVGHSGEGVLHDIIFLFHMPLFFILSGFLLESDRAKEKEYLTCKAKRLLIPYVGYLLVNLLLVRRDYSMSSLIHAFYGGRAFSGAYWYTTCFLFTLAIFSLLLKLYRDEKVKRLILIGGAAVIESHLVTKIPLLQYPGIPWNLDVSLMALVYVGIGYFYKSLIKEIIEDDSMYFDMLAVGIAIILGIFGFFNYHDGNCFCYFDMKPVYYKELFSAILIPCSFGFLLERV